MSTLSPLDPPGFDVTKDTPICQDCNLVIEQRIGVDRWTCRRCGTVVCTHRTADTYLDGGCTCRHCARWLNSKPVRRARLQRLGLNPDSADKEREEPDGQA